MFATDCESFNDLEEAKKYGDIYLKNKGFIFLEKTNLQGII